ncbi:hypothetical protein [Deinococcus rubellus]|uniref:Uncharacterized protein n=1 Tax=Deinococcus rubellus TaxID=1889240 RepID=A0ABY5YMI6_9DEIO|nr:hypothetical protein [Deinococcus rubellus]UWX65331.1 hypothetical protein N0D28_06670 [Deinococcus rubellus]
MTDITALKGVQASILALNETLEERVVQRTAQIQELNEELETFVQSTMLALDTPLRHIGSFAALLRQKLPQTQDPPTDHTQSTTKWWGPPNGCRCWPQPSPSISDWGGSGRGSFR